MGLAFDFPALAKFGARGAAARAFSSFNCFASGALTVPMPIRVLLRCRCERGMAISSVGSSFSEMFGRRGGPGTCLCRSSRVKLTIVGAEANVLRISSGSDDCLFRAEGFGTSLSAVIGGCGTELRVLSVKCLCRWRSKVDIVYLR